MNAWRREMWKLWSKGERGSEREGGRKGGKKYVYKQGEIKDEDM